MYFMISFVFLCIRSITCLKSQPVLLSTNFFLFLQLYLLVHLELYQFLVVLLIHLVHHLYDISCTTCMHAHALHLCSSFCYLLYILFVFYYSPDKKYYSFIAGLDYCLYALFNLDRNYNMYQTIVS